MARFSRMATSTGSAARKVLSSTRPVRTFFSLVRTKAPPLPGLTCWNSTTFIKLPSMFRVIPFFRSFVVGIGASSSLASGSDASRAVRPSQLDELLGCGGEELVAARTDDREILDPHAAEAGKVDTWFDGHWRPARDATTGSGADPWRLVDLEPDAVPGGVGERVAEPCLGDDLPAGAVDLARHDPGTQRGQPGRLGGQDQLVDLALALGGAPEDHRAGASRSRGRARPRARSPRPAGCRAARRGRRCRCGRPRAWPRSPPRP